VRLQEAWEFPRIYFLEKGVVKMITDQRKQRLRD